jgi:hypothetical protein
MLAAMYSVILGLYIENVAWGLSTVTYLYLNLLSPSTSLSHVQAC